MKFVHFFLALILFVLQLLFSQAVLAQKKTYHPLFEEELTKKEVRARYNAFAEQQKAEGWTAKQWRKANKQARKERKALLKSGPIQVSVDSLILAPNSSDWKEVSFKNKTYVGQDKQAFSGRLISYYENGIPKLEAVVIQGKLNGLAKEYYPSGQLKIQRNYIQGAMSGQVEEYFENGQLKLVGQITGINSHGGDQIEDVTVGYFKNGTYRTRKMKQARIQFINQEGRTPSRNEALDLEVQAGYMLFDRSRISGEEIYTPDSRRVEGPESSSNR